LFPNILNLTCRLCCLISGHGYHLWAVHLLCDQSLVVYCGCSASFVARWQLCVLRGSTLLYIGYNRHQDTSLSVCRRISPNI